MYVIHLFQCFPSDCLGVIFYLPLCAFLCVLYVTTKRVVWTQIAALCHQQVVRCMSNKRARTVFSLGVDCVHFFVGV